MQNFKDNCYNQESFLILAEESPNMIFIISENRIVFANKKCENVLGYTKEEFISEKFKYEDLIANESKYLLKSVYNESYKNVEIPLYKFTLLAKSGEKIEAIIITKLINFQGKQAILEIISDIVKQDKNEINEFNGKNYQRYELEKLNKKLLESNRRLKEQVVMDSKTGLYNFRFLGDLLETEFSCAKRYNQPFSMLKIDIDYFKSINDVYGHKFADIILQQFAKKLQENVRKYNTIVRFGGEEFVIVSPKTNRSAAINLGQRLLDIINIHNFGDKKNKVRLKLSIAVVSFPEDVVIRAMDMVEIADRVLAKAKELGGNRLISTLDLKESEKPSKHGKAIFSDINYLRNKIDRLNKRANQSLIEAIFAFAKTIEMKDHYTGEHAAKTVYFATQIAEKLGLKKEEIMLIKQAAILHDLGKVGVKEKILLKPRRLNKKEIKKIREHPLIGAAIIRPIRLLHNIVPLIMYHHERWDGKGYPMGLKGKEIPIGARVISLADAYQALISNRPYRKAYSKANAIKIIKKGYGTQFDPDIVDIFLGLLNKNKKK